MSAATATEHATDELDELEAIAVRLTEMRDAHPVGSDVWKAYRAAIERMDAVIYRMQPERRPRVIGGVVKPGPKRIGTPTVVVARRPRR